jgi:diaminohydroxyphosphoribosylaminopyrimidine deaminase / 5-amino-6-(5-phosphoribosylamino)uracil reductase
VSPLRHDVRASGHPRGDEMSDQEQVDVAMMQRAMANAARVRPVTSPNPWVGSVIVTPPDAAVEQIADGATAKVGGPHAEIAALSAIGDAARGATLYSTLEPCSHTGRTGPCTRAIISAGIARVVIGIEDPDPLVAGRGVAELREAGLDVMVGVEAAVIRRQLRAYLTHRTTGRPHVVLKLAATLDGRIAAPDGSSIWITGAEARLDAHRLRSESDAILVGAGTVRADNPSLTTRHVAGRDPLRVVLGAAPADARVQPCLEHDGPLDELLTDLAARGVLQLLVEGGSQVAHQFHSQRLVDEYVIYVAPALLGGDDGIPLMSGPGEAAMADVWRGRFTDVERLGDDLRLVVEPA